MAASSVLGHGWQFRRPGVMEGLAARVPLTAPQLWIGHVQILPGHPSICMSTATRAAGSREGHKRVLDVTCQEVGKDHVLGQG